MTQIVADFLCDNLRNLRFSLFPSSDLIYDQATFDVMVVEIEAMFAFASVAVLLRPLASGIFSTTAACC
jgi:hypothetical protein